MLRNYLRHLYNFRLLIYFFVVFSALIFISIVYPLIPLNGDEVRTYLDFAQHGSLFSITHYEVPNNHVFFTFLQSFFLHKKILLLIPYEIRLLNTIICLLFFAFLSYIFTTLLKKKMSLFVFLFLTLLCFFASPLLTPYFIVARGYLLGSLLLLAGAFFLSTNKFYLAAFSFILSVWTIPTFMFAVPLQYVGALLVNRRVDQKKVIISGLLVPIGSIILYFPVWKDLLGNANMGWGYESLNIFSLLTLNSVSNFSYIRFGFVINIWYLIIFIFSFFFIQKKADEALRRFVLFLLLSIAGYLIIVLLFFLLGITSLPFVRNGLFIPLFVALTILFASFMTKGKVKGMLEISLLLNILIGIFLLTNLFPMNKKPYPAFNGDQKYTSKSLIQFLTNKNVKYLSIDGNDNVLIMYYSFIYSIPIKEK